MKTKLFSIFTTFILFSTVYLPLSIAQDYTTWNLPEGAKARLGKGTIEDIQFSPDNKLLAVAGSIGVWIYDADSLEELVLLGHTLGVTSVAFSPDGSLLVSGGLDTTIRLWNVSNFTLNRTITGHTGAVNDVAFSPDGLTLVSASADKTVGIWSPFSGEEKMRITGHTDAVTSVAFSPDGLLLASGSADKTVRLWNTVTGDHQQTLTGHTAAVTSVEFNPNGKMIASGSLDTTIRLWDTATGEHKHILRGNIYPYNGFSVCFHPEGMMLAGASGAQIRLWAVLSGELKQEFSSFSFNPTPPLPNYNRVCFSPDGLTLAGAGRKGILTLWKIFPQPVYQTFGNFLFSSVSFSPDGLTYAGAQGPAIHDSNFIPLVDVSTGALKQTFATEDSGFVYDTCFSADGKTLASVGTEIDLERPRFMKGYRTIRLWDVSTGALKQEFPLKSFSSGVFSPDGLTLASSRHGKNQSTVIGLFDIFTSRLKQSFSTREITRLYFSPDSKTLITGHEDGTIRLWDVETGSLKQRLIGHTAAVAGIQFSPDGKTLASGSSRPEMTIRLWDAVTGEHLHTLDTRGLNPVWNISFSIDSKVVTNSDLDSGPGLVWRLLDYNYNWGEPPRLWDVETGKQIQLNISDSYSLAILNGWFSPDGSMLVGGGLWNLYSFEQPRQITGHTSWVQSVSFSPDGKRLAVGSEDAIRLWDVDTATPTLKNTYPFNATTVAFSSAHQRFLSGSWDNTIRLWNVVSNRQEKTFIGHTGSINSVVFTIGSREFASGSADKTIRLWSVGTGETVKTFTGHTDSVLTLATNPHLGGVFLASGSADKTVYLWSYSGEEPLRTLTGHTDAVLSVAYNPNLHSVSAHPDLVAATLNPRNVSLDPDLQAAYVAERGGLITVHGAGFQVMLASGSADKTIHLWDGVGGAHMGTLTGHSAGVSSLAFSPDGETLMSGSSDATIRWWELGKVVETESLKDADQTVIWEDPFIGTHKHTLTGHTGGVTSLAFSPITGWTLASGSYDGTVLLWDLFGFTPPSKRELAEDINDDGVVNIQDLVLVASNLGERGENPADVNADGVVNIQDLVLVAGELGNASAAPSTWRDNFAFTLTSAEVEQWLTQAQQLNLTDATSQRGIRFLEQLLLTLTPKETALLPNYPNPFNPETWIPYQLAEPADVTLHIHAVDGSLVCTLSLGHKAVGSYQTRSRAAYWDGRNEVGEPVASGVYFYTLTAGDFTATRKMLIRK